MTRPLCEDHGASLLDHIADKSAEAERCAILVGLCDLALRDVRHLEGAPMWRRAIWLALHPLRLLRINALHDAVALVNARSESSK